MLNKRFRYDKKSILILTDLQSKYKKIVENKLKNKEYNLERVKCVICENEEFELLSEKDRYGLYAPVVICKICGLVQSNPRMTQESYNKFYDLEYRKLYHGDVLPVQIYFKNQKLKGKRIYKFVEKVIGEPIKNKFVVEIGTGAGGILKIFKERGNTVLGLDLGSKYIEFGKQHSLNLKVGTIEELSKLKRKPDIVIYSHVLEHVLNPINELKLLRKNLKPDSLVVIIVPGIKNLVKSYDQDFLRYLQNAHTYHFSLQTLKNIMNQAGFSMVYGNENIDSIFKLTKPQNKYITDYEESKKFLIELEKIRNSPLNLIRIKTEILNTLLLFLTLTKTKRLFKKVSLKLKYNLSEN